MSAQQEVHASLCESAPSAVRAETYREPAGRQLLGGCRPRVYLSGPLSNADPVQAAMNRAAFRDSEQVLTLAGYEVVCPLDNGKPETATWEQHMRADIKLMMDCDGVALVPATDEARMASRGTGAECNLAQWLRMPVGEVADWLSGAAPTA